MSLIQKSQKALEYDKILTELSKYAKTEQSRFLCLYLTPFVRPEEIKKELLYTSEAKNLLDYARDIPVEDIVDFSKLSIKNEYFTETELYSVAKTLRTFRLVKNFLKENLLPEAALNDISENLFSDKSFEDKIFDTFDENCVVKQTATPELKGMYMSLRDTETILKQKVQELITSSEFQSHLQENIYTLRDERIVFQVKASSKSKVPGIVHDVSATSKTFYIEPAQIVPFNNKIRELKSRIYAAVIQILTSLSKEIRSRLDELKQSEKTLALIDFHFAKARYAVSIQAVAPEITEEKIVKIDAIRHPLLIGTVEKIVENDFEIGNEYKSIIITGSNTGGKTVTLKAVGLSLLMAKSGMFIPCADAKIYPFEKVYADIGDEQSILQSLSTFSSHMKTIIEILNAANSETFVLLDELCAGTDPMEGAILAEVILNELSKKETFSVVTTHYGELKTLEYNNRYFKNACVEFDTETLKPTYKLIIGVPGLSNAISISANLGLPESLVEEARNTVKAQRDPARVAVEMLQETQLKLSSNLKEAEEKNIEANALKDLYEKELSQHKKEKKRNLKIIKDRFEFQLDDAKNEIKEILKELRQEKTEKVARRAYSRLAKLEHEFREELEKQNDKEYYKELDWEKVSLNEKVMLKELNQSVEILSMPDKNGNLYILMGAIKTKIHKDRLAVYNQELEKKTYLPSYHKEDFILKKYDITNTLDLRGERVEAALDKLENYLDKASLANLTPVYIIHGHGTGALKAAVRDYVKESPYVSKFNIGEEAEGGDGVCVIELK